MPLIRVTNDVFLKQQRGTAVVLNTFVPYVPSTDAPHYRRKLFFSNTEVRAVKTNVGFITGDNSGIPVVQSSDVFIGQDTFQLGWAPPEPPFIRPAPSFLNLWQLLPYNPATSGERFRDRRVKYFAPPEVYVQEQYILNFGILNTFITLVTVPDVTGEDLASATADLNINQLQAFVQGSQYDNVNPIGTVSAQSPIGGVLAPINSTVNLIMSLGPQPSPPFPGVTLPDAIFIAINAGLVVGQPIVWQYDPVIPYNYVISQNPPAGSNIPQQSVVTFVVSLGPAPTAPGAITVNDYTGLMILDAQQQAINDGLSRSNNVVWQYSTTVNNQYVISQSIAPGTVVPFGTAIVFTVSAGFPSTTLPGATIVTPTMH